MMPSAPLTYASPKPYRIAYLLADPGVPFYDSQKGASIHARSLIKAFEQEGCEVDVYVMRRGRARLRGFRVQQVPMSRLTRWFHETALSQGALARLLWRRGGAGARPSAPNRLTALGALLWQRDFWRGVRCEVGGRAPDAVYARHAYMAYGYARLQRAWRTPMALEVNAVLTVEKGLRGEIGFARLTEKIERDAFAASKIVLPVTEELKEQTLRLCDEPRKVIVTPNAVDLDLFRPRELRRPGPDREFVIGCVHSYKIYHGMDVLLEAARRLRAEIPRLRALLVGGGDGLPEVRRRAAEMGLGDCVEFTDTVDHAEVPGLLRRFDVGVAPYHGPFNQYGCPMKLYEYMAAKVPMVVASWGDIPNVLTHGENALLHREGDPQSLADMILRVYRDAALGERLAEKAYEYVQNHTWRARARDILARLKAPNDT
ncbi:MAG: glycosyltransferase family 4 protein [Candidatus Sumerlaeota bacterium]|nr:glycosyltransferase family 4 protein [Candidatus Sumerlaeota bacterium]